MSLGLKKIGLYGGLANNLYLLAKALHKSGNDVIYIRERDINYPLSQPVWEDMEFSFSIDELAAAANYTASEWNQIEKELGWKQPDWMYDPLEKYSSENEYKQLQKLRMGFSKTDAYILHQLKQCDFLVVTGIKASILAYMSGVPYVIQPHGGDIMVAAGFLRNGNCKNWLEFLFGNRWEKLATEAFKCANAIAVHNKNINQFGPQKKRILPFKKSLHISFQELATYTPIGQLKCKSDRRALLLDVSERTGFHAPSEEKKIVFIPSRIDYHWKGQNKFLKAFRNKKIKENFFFIFSGWGLDLKRLQAECSVLEISSTFLGFVISKPLLYKVMAASDIVVDNFVSGHYGTTGAEAMGQGASLLMWCDAKQYGEDMPPVLNAQTPDEIEKILLAFSTGDINSEESRTSAHDWALEHHSENAINKQLLNLI